MRFIITSDWELTRERLPIAEIILKELMSYRKSTDQFVFDGDMFREYNAVTESFAHKILGETIGNIFIVGNHDREIGADRLSAAFPAARVFASPQVLEICGVFIGILPAPDRAAFGASRGPEGKRARDQALSGALEAALISLETQIGPENLGRAILFFHGALSGEELAGGQIAGGLTWSIPAARLSRWGLCIGGHIHKPGQSAPNVWSVGGIANWTFSDKAEQFRALVVDTDTLAVSEIPLLRALVPIELTLDEEGLHGGDIAIEAYDPGAIMGVLEACGITLDSDTISLKIRARLPRHEMSLVPTADDLKAAINELVERPLIQNCIITREITGLHKARIESTTSARQMTLEEMLDLYIQTSALEMAPEMIDLSKALLNKVASTYRPGDGAFGFKPLTLEVNNFRQWESATIDFSNLSGAVVVTGPNESGKTNLLEALLFALYKRSPSSASTIDEELRRAATDGSVVLTFGAHGDEYKLSRALERGRGGVTCKTEFLRWTGEEPSMWEAVSDGANDADKRVAEIIGSYDFLRWLIFRSQRDLDRLIEATPAEWHKIALQTFNLSALEPVRKAAANEAENSKLRAEQTGIRAEEIGKSIASAQTALDALGAADDLRVAIEGYDAQIADYRSKRAELEAERSTAIEKRSAIRARANQKTELQSRIAALKRATMAPFENIGARPEVPTVDIAILDAKAVNLKNQRDNLLDADAAKRKEIAKAQAEEQAHGESFKRIGAEIELLEAQIKGHDASLWKLEPAACIDGRQDRCRAWLYYSKADRGKELQGKLENAKERIRVEMERQAAADNLVVALTGTLEPITAELNAIAPRLRELEAQIGEYRNALHAAELWDERAKAQAQAMEQRAAKQREIGDLESQIVALGDFDSELAIMQSDLQKIEMRFGGLDSLISAAEGCRREEQRALDTVDYQAKQILTLTAELTEREAEEKAHARSSAAWGLLANAFHATGIPYLLMERNIGRVESIANELLAASGSDLRVRIETITPTKKGEARDKLSVFFIDSRGEFPLCKASGEQAVVLSMALSPALSIAGSEFWGATAEIFIQDEGWDRVDLQHREILRALIGEIAARFGRFLFIAHLDWLIASADMELRVEAENGTSRLVG